MAGRRRIVVVLLALLIAGCEEEGSPGSQATVTVTEPAPGAPSTRATAPEPQQGVVPNVVGVNHQLAQDTMQAAGFYILTEEDATGQHRLLIVDRNWVVVSQEPKGGTKAPPETKIILRSKKIGE